MIYFLIGFMGSGKSTVGRLLAAKLDMPFSDTDVLIEQETKLSVNSIFAQYGEEHFRRLEAELVRDIKKDAGIVSCGGGLPCYNNLMDELLKKGTVIYLRASEGTLFERLKNATAERPLLEIATLQETIRKRLAGRSECYEKAQIIIDTDDLSAEEVLKEICKRIQA